MKTFSKARVGTMIQHSTTTKFKELSPKSHNRSKDENMSQKVTIMRMILPSDCNPQLCTPQS